MSIGILYIVLYLNFCKHISNILILYFEFLLWSSTLEASFN